MLLEQQMDFKVGQNRSICAAVKIPLSTMVMPGPNSAFDLSTSEFGSPCSRHRVQMNK
jgi:hypothetical protein